MELIKINRDSGIPLLGVLPFGVVDRGKSNLIQVRATSLCNMNCSFCSTDGGPYSKHTVNYEVDIDYLLDYVKEVVKLKGETIVFLDSVGEPLMHPKFVELVEGINKIKDVKESVVITNGTLLNETKIKKLEKAKLKRINMSFHSMNDKAKKLFGMDNYDVKKVLKNIELIKKSKIDLMLTPVLIPGVNEEDVREIIDYCKENDIKIGLQKYEIHKNGRKVKGAKILNYYKFYKLMDEWEKEFDIKLKYGPNDFKIKRAESIPKKFKKNEKVDVELKIPGWFKDQMIGVANDRCVTVMNANKKGRKKVKIIEDYNGLYLAK